MQFLGEGKERELETIVSKLIAAVELENHDINNNPNILTIHYCLLVCLGECYSPSTTTYFSMINQYN